MTERAARPGRPRSYARDAVLAEAVGAFWTRGYTATSMRELVQATGVAPKSLYAEFGDKDGIFVAAIDAYIAEHTARYRGLLGTEPLGLDPIQRYYESFAVAYDRRGCLLVSSLGEIEVIPGAAARRIDRFFTWLEELYEQNLLAAARAGALRQRTHLRPLAAALVTFDQGLAVASRSIARRAMLAAQALRLLDCLRA